MKEIARIIKTTRELWRLYAAIGFFTVSIAIMNLIIPLLSGWAIDEVGRGDAASISYLIWIAAGIFALDFGITIFSNIGGYIGDLMGARVKKILGIRYYEHLLTLSQSYFDTELTGKIINRLNRSIEQIGRFLQILSNNFLQFLFSTIFSLIVVAFISWQVALLLGTLYPIFIWLTIKTSDRWQKYQAEINQQYDLATGRFNEAVSQIKVVKSFLQEKREIRFFDRHTQRAIKTTYPQSKLWHTRDVQRRIVLNIIFFAVYVVIFVLAAQGQYSPGQAVTLILYAMQIRIPIFTISFLVDSFQRASADSRDYFEVMAIKPRVEDKTYAKGLKVTEGHVKFENVTFHYEDERPVLKGVTFELASNTKTALVGVSGGGKTTVTNLLLRLYDAESGSITIDGQDISSISQKSLRENIGVVFQDPSLFSGTIKENIAYGDPRATQSAIEKAAKAAHAHGFIEKLSKGYDSQIGEKGIKLSGGQKQRIAIARAILKDAPILILDEATSSLDSQAEAHVQAALEYLMKDKTTLIIAHRLSTIQNVDNVVVLKNGTVSEQGPPKELEATGGLYSQLLALQDPTIENKEKLERYGMIG